MNVIFTEHARERLVKRDIRERMVIQVLENPDNIYYDLREGNFVAVRKIIEEDKKKLLIVIFAETAEGRLGIPENRVKKGRWIEL
ncbi:MAG: DUF4258 domain-containing protein [Methanosarcinales archaeon]